VWSFELGVPASKGLPKNGKEACSQSAIEGLAAAVVLGPTGIGVTAMLVPAGVTALATSRAMSAYSLIRLMGSGSNSKNHRKAGIVAMMGPRQV